MRLGLVNIDGQERTFRLVVDSDNVLYFNHDSDEAFVNDNWDDNAWNDNSLVGF